MNEYGEDEWPVRHLDRRREIHVPGLNSFAIMFSVFFPMPNRICGNSTSRWVLRVVQTFEWLSGIKLSGRVRAWSPYGDPLKYRV